MKRYLLILLIFVVPNLLAFQEKLEKARLLKEASLFDSAIALYHDILRNSRDDCSEDEEEKAFLKNIHFSLAECYYQNENFLKTIEVIEGKCDTNNEHLLLAMAFNRLKRYEEAISTLYSNPDVLKVDQAIYQLGFAFFYSNKLEEAASNFERLAIPQWIQKSVFRLRQSPLVKVKKNRSILQYEPVFFDSTKGAFTLPKYQFLNPLRYNSSVVDLAYLSRIYLARIYLNAGCFERAESLLSGLELLLQDHVLLKELIYLQGQLFFQKGDYKKAAAAFEKVIPTLKMNNPNLYDEVLCHLGWSYLNPYLKGEDTLYLDFSANKDKESLLYAKNLYLKGLNDFEEGRTLFSRKKQEDAVSSFERAAYFLGEAADLFKKEDKKLAGLSLKYQAESFAEEHCQEGFLKAFSILDTLIQKNPEILAEMTDPDEIYYLRALVLLKLGSEELAVVDQKKNHLLIEASLTTNLALYPNGKFADLSLNLLGLFYYQNKEYKEAAKRFLELSKSVSWLKVEGLFYAALSFEAMNEVEKAKDLRKRIYTEYPDSKYAADSYFRYYSYQEYVQGDRSSIKHLQSFVGLFRDTELLLNAHYLLGMDYTRDRKTIDGKWIRKKSLTSAIDHFQLAVSSFDKFYSEGKLQQELDYFVTVRYFAMLEKGITCLKVAEESTSTKRDIYLEYAQNVFSEIVEDYKNKENSLVHLLDDKEPFPNLQEESLYYLAMSYIKAKNNPSAKKVFDEMIKTYQSLNITRGYFLSRIFYEFGVLLKQEEEYAFALQKLNQAEDAAKGKVLSGEQKLDLWIEQSLCYLGLKQYDKAILILSKVVNCDMVSHQRLKAMFLRAEVYACDGRFELSRKQLEAVAKKGGEWAVKAQQKLENLK